MSWPSLLPLKMSIAEEELHRAGGLARGEGEFHCFSRKAVTPVSVCSWLVISPLGTSGAHRAPTVHARVKTISVVFEGVECQVTKSCPGRKSLFSLPPGNIAWLHSFHFTYPFF